MISNNDKKKGKTMKLKLDWKGMLKAALKAVWPFLAGATGGLLSGCSIFGSGVGATIA